MSCLNFTDLVLLIGTNPLPNFVVAEYFLSNNDNLKNIWLLHSENNSLQAGTKTQAENLEELLRQRWKGNHSNLYFPLEKVSLSDVSNSETIRREIERKMINRLEGRSVFHLNYTGGTKAMATHVYNHLEESKNSGNDHFSYLDANNFRLVADNRGVIAEDLRQSVQMEFADLIALHGFQRRNKDMNDADFDKATQAYQKYISDPESNRMNEQDGKPFEVYLEKKLKDNFGGRLNYGKGVLRNWEIKKPQWLTHFELDIILMNGYHLTGISCTVSYKKDSCKSKGFEIILRTRQIGGDEARAVLITRSNKNKTRLLQEELVYETGRNHENILVLGIDDLRNEALYLRKIEKFVFE